MSQKNTSKPKPPSRYDYIAKVTILGDSTVGKSSLVTKFTENFFSYNQLLTVGVDFKLKTVNVAGKKVKLEIWDTSGQERFRKIATDNLKRAHGVILCYAVNDRDSFMHIESWMEQIKNSPSKDAPIVLVATKKDLYICKDDKDDENSPRHVDEAEGKALAVKYGVPFLETSSADGTNVKEVFETISRLVLEKHDPVIEPLENPNCCLLAFSKLFGKNKEEAKKQKRVVKGTIMMTSQNKPHYKIINNYEDRSF